MAAASRSSVLLCSLLVLVVVPSGWGLHCYECSSADGEPCGDPFHKTHDLLVDCGPANSTSSPNRTAVTSGKQTVCKKVEQTVDGRLGILRECHDEDWPGEACAANKSAGVLFCQSCRTDGCNSANPAHLVALTIVLSAAALARVIGA